MTIVEITYIMDSGMFDADYWDPDHLLPNYDPDASATAFADALHDLIQARYPEAAITVSFVNAEGGGTLEAYSAEYDQAEQADTVRDLGDLCERLYEHNDPTLPDWIRVTEQTNA